MKKEMLINVLQPEECRIAILEDSILEELSVERTSHESYVGNIYKGKIVNIEPSIQAAFVDFGIGRNGFLHVSDVEPTYYRHLEQGRNDRGPDRGRDRDRGNDRERGFDRDRDRGRDRGGPDRGRDRDRHAERPPERERPPQPFVEPEPEPTGFGAFVEPEPAPAAQPVEETSFGAGVLDAEPPPPPEPVAKAAPAVPEPPAEVDEPAPKPPLVALPETILPEEEPTRRRRSRSTPRRKPKAGAEDDKTTPPDDKPPLMESAERRTTDHDPETGPLSAGDADDLLFFPRADDAPAPAVEPEPIEEEEPEAELEPEPERPVEPFVPPSRPRSVTSRRSIEDELRADLAAAEVGGSAEDMEGEPLPRPEAEGNIEDVFEGDLEEGPPRGRGDRGDRGPGGPRDRGPGRGHGPRGDRDHDRGRGGPGDRRPPPRRGFGGGRPGADRPRPNIQDIFKRGQEVLVMVIKDGIGTKGPTLSTYISIAGRYLVLVPWMNRTGVSRKIMDEDKRLKLKQMFNELRPPKGPGFIMRTAAIDRNKRELQRDLAYLARLWQIVVRRIKKQKGPCEVYQESDIVTRTIRDIFTSQIDTIWVDEPNAFEHAQEFLQVVMPRFADRIKLYEGKEPLFHKFGIENEMARIQQRKVPLPHGGSIVIEQTEALVAIDVNSGNFRAADNNSEETMYQMNLHAAREIARQLRLRNLGGVIVNDFIDMREEKHKRAVEKALRDAMKRDRARTKILKMSAFGIIEMTRQRTASSLKRSVYQDCPHCKGMAQVKTVESMGIEVMRLLQLAAHREHVVRVEATVTQEVSDYLLNRKRREISKMEEDGDIQVQVRGVHHAPPELLEFAAYDRNGNEVKYNTVEEPGRPRR